MFDPLEPTTGPELELLVDPAPLRVGRFDESTARGVDLRHTVPHRGLQASVGDRQAGGGRDGRDESRVIQERLVVHVARLPDPGLGSSTGRPASSTYDAELAIQ